MEKQKELFQKDALVQDRSYLEKEAARAIKEYEESPTVTGKIHAAVDALVKLDDDGAVNQAIDILAKAHRDSGAYQFKSRMGDLKILLMAREYRRLLADNDKAGAAKLARTQLAFELEEYAERAANYPTDLAVRFELGRRQFLSGKLDDAISAFQQAQRDPRRHVESLIYIGQAFARKGWYREAAETYQKTLEGELSESRMKEVRYGLGDVLEKMGQLEQARDEFSHVAQVDFNFKDIRRRLEALRGKLEQQGGGPDEAAETK